MPLLISFVCHWTIHYLLSESALDDMQEDCEVMMTAAFAATPNLQLPHNSNYKAKERSQDSPAFDLSSVSTFELTNPSCTAWN